MSTLSDIFKGNEQATTTPATPTPVTPEPQGNIIQRAWNGLFGGAQTQPTPTPAPPAKTGPLTDIFKSTPTSSQTTSTSKSSPLSSIFNTKPTTTPYPYFSGSSPSGATIGYSLDQKDASGKPFFAYRNPGDTATTTDTTRVATTFDPRTPQKITTGSFTTPRAVENRASLKTAMGGTYNDELDHKIALELAGSNDKSNLQIEPMVAGTKNTATDPLENSLARDVISGKVSLFDAQTQLAKAKGMTIQ